MTTRSQMIVRRLREGVLDGLYPGGARMNEVDLAETLGVSRTPVRAALSILATEGLLKYTPNSGFVVQTFTSKDIEGIYELRSTLSGLAVRLAAENGLSGEQLERLQRIVAQSTEFIEAHNWSADHPKRWEQLAHEFHRVLYEAADNPHLVAALGRTHEIPLIREIRFRWLDPDYMLRSHNDHIAILEAVQRGQQLRAESLTRELIYRNGQRIVQHWRRIEASSAPDDGAANTGTDTGTDTDATGAQTAAG
ncbi:MAG: bacterial regulatory s, gntR family protein [Devosia sp.]|nr:bacterial regulatory s, gntR family protein [Devosia sp.]